MSRKRHVLLLILAFAALFSLSGEAALARHYDSEEIRFLQLINAYREQHGVAPLKASDTLAEAAARHSLDMANFRFFDHTSQKSSYFPAGSSPWERMRLTGYPGNAMMGENLAAGQQSAQQVFDSWRGSPGHNKNMLSGSYRVIGIARRAVTGSPFTYYWTTDFGSVVDGSTSTAKAPQDPFTDVTQADRELWDAAWFVKRQGYFLGYSSGSLGCWQPMTRRHVALVLERAGLGSRPDWLQDYRLATRGEVMAAFPGLSWNSGRANEQMLRSQLVRLLYRAR
jgi:uncharacterized protein YkwD